MSFFPLSSVSFNPFIGFGESLFGATDMTKFNDFNDFNKIEDKNLFDRNIHSPTDANKYRTITTIVISAILFATIISIYDVLRNYIIIYYADMTPEENINKTLLNRLKESLYFSIF